MTITFGGTGKSSADTIAVRHFGIELLPELGYADHEEADTRLIYTTVGCSIVHA